jgi:Glutamine amidotransferases class-II
MCLIAYVPAGKRIPENYFRSAAHDNDDGIGIMWKDGVEKFLGNKMVKRAWRLARRLHDTNQEFAVHFRYATHGRVALVNTHPFRTPCGNAYVMHNGILTDYTPKNAGGDMSDTRNLVNVMKMQPDTVTEDKQYWELMAEHIGWGNKLCVMSRDGDFRIVNSEAGDWLDGVWYSQTYSLPVTDGFDWNGYYNRRYGSTAVGNYSTGGYYSKTDLLDEQRPTILTSTEGTTATALIPYKGDTYAQRSALASMKRHEIPESEWDKWVRENSQDTGTMGSGTRALPAGHYRAEAEALDRELDKHFAKMDDGVEDDDPTDICPSCETLHSDGAVCPECGYIDPQWGLLAAGMS